MLACQLGLSQLCWSSIQIFAFECWPEFLIVDPKYGKCQLKKIKNVWKCAYKKNARIDRSNANDRIDRSDDWIQLNIYMFFFSWLVLIDFDWFYRSIRSSSIAFDWFDRSLRSVRSIMFFFIMYPAAYSFVNPGDFGHLLKTSADFEEL